MNKGAKLGEHQYTRGLLNATHYYDNDKIRAVMQVCLHRGKNSHCFFSVAIKIFESIPNKPCGGLVGYQSCFFHLDGVHAKEFDTYRDNFNPTYPNEKNTIDKKYMPWVLSAMEFLKEKEPITAELQQ